MIFRDRFHAGRCLATRLQGYSNRSDVIVLALPHGGVPVGYEVARAIGAPLDVFLVRNLALPGQEEFAIGAIASGGVRVLNSYAPRRFHVLDEDVEQIVARELAELQRCEEAYRGSTDPPSVSGQTVIFVEDGVATGSTMRAAAAALRTMDPARIVVAVPVRAQSSCEEFSGLVDEVVCAETSESSRAVRDWYGDFSPTTDEEIRKLLKRDAERRGATKEGSVVERLEARWKGAVPF